jgi:hypothetical protein
MTSEEYALYNSHPFDFRNRDSSSTVLNSVLRLIENHLSEESEKPLVVHSPGYISRCPALQEALRGVL